MHHLLFLESFTMESDTASRRRKNKKQKEAEVQTGNLFNLPTSSSDIHVFTKADTTKVKRVDRFDSLWFVVGIFFVVFIASMTWEMTHYVPTLTSPVSYRNLLIDFFLKLDYPVSLPRFNLNLTFITFRTFRSLVTARGMI